MKKYFIVLVAIILALSFGSVASARDAGNPLRGDVKPLVWSGSTCTHVTSTPSLVYALTVRANTATGWGSIIDSGTAGSESPTTAAYVAAKITANKVVAFVGEATQYDTARVEFNPPLYCESGIFFYDGIGILVNNGGDGVQAIIEYGPAN